MTDLGEYDYDDFKQLMEDVTDLKRRVKRLEESRLSDKAYELLANAAEILYAEGEHDFGREIAAWLNKHKPGGYELP